MKAERGLGWVEWQIARFSQFLPTEEQGVGEKILILQSQELWETEAL